jgi:hypothetical protein
MSNFAHLFESLKNKDSHKEYEDGQAIEAIQNGMNLSETFWEDFLSVMNNSEALSALLGVPSFKINKWRGRISKYLTKYYEQDEITDYDVKKKRKLVDTEDYYP